MSDNSYESGFYKTAQYVVPAIGKAFNENLRWGALCIGSLTDKGFVPRRIEIVGDRSFGDGDEASFLAYAKEKPTRVGGEHALSWMTRDPSKGQFGGGTQFSMKHAGAFSAYTEPVDQALMLAWGVMEQKTPEGHARGLATLCDYYDNSPHQGKHILRFNTALITLKMLDCYR